MRDLPQPPAPLPGGKLPGKLLVVEHVYHQRPDSQPTGVESRYSRWLTTDAPSHVDEFTAENEWQPVQVGRMRGVGLMLVENLEGTDLLSVPSPQQRQEIASRVLGVAFVPAHETPFALCAGVQVLPGETCRFQPAAGVTVHVQCMTAGQRVKVRVTSIPA